MTEDRGRRTEDRGQREENGGRTTERNEGCDDGGDGRGRSTDDLPRAERLAAARASLGAAAERALRLLAEADGAPAVLCHGDYLPGNLLVAGEVARGIDWNGAALGPLESEVAKSLLLMAAAPPTLAWGEALHAHRHAITQRYWKRLLTAQLIEPTAADRWLDIRLVEFLARPVPALHATLQPLAERWLPAGEARADDLWS